MTSLQPVRLQKGILVGPYNSELTCYWPVTLLLIYLFHLNGHLTCDVLGYDSLLVTDVSVESTTSIFEGDFISLNSADCTVW